MHKKVVVFAGNECSKEKEKYYYPLAYETGKQLAESGFVTVTGGGPGLMNQVCKGAFEATGEVVGICLNLSGRKQSEYLTRKESFDHLRPRQERLISLGDAFIAIPGGVGTCFEIFEILSLKRKKDIELTKPLILVDAYFRELNDLLQKMEKEEFVQLDVNTFYELVDTPTQAVSILKRYYGL